MAMGTGWYLGAAPSSPAPRAPHPLTFCRASRSGLPCVNAKMGSLATFREGLCFHRSLRTRAGRDRQVSSGHHGQVPSWGCKARLGGKELALGPGPTGPRPAAVHPQAGDFPPLSHCHGSSVRTLSPDSTVTEPTSSTESAHARRLSLLSPGATLPPDPRDFRPRAGQTAHPRAAPPRMGRAGGTPRRGAECLEDRAVQHVAGHLGGWPSLVHGDQEGWPRGPCLIPEDWVPRAP